jgi:hypothetical protein
MLGGWAATAGNPAGAEAAVVRGGSVGRRNLARFSFRIAVRWWIAALKGLASEIRFRPSRYCLNAAGDLDKHEAQVVAETPKTLEKVSGLVGRMQAEERSSAVAPD